MIEAYKQKKQQIELAYGQSPSKNGTIPLLRLQEGIK